MAEIDDKDPRAMEGMKELRRRVMLYFGQMRPMNEQSVKDLRDMVYNFRSGFKQRYGLTFPELVAMVVPSAGEVKFFRRDWPDAEIEKNLLYMIQGYQKLGKIVPVEELAWSVKQAWPHYKPPAPAELKVMEGKPQ